MTFRTLNFAQQVARLHFSTSSNVLAWRMRFRLDMQYYYAICISPNLGTWVLTFCCCDSLAVVLLYAIIVCVAKQALNLKLKALQSLADVPLPGTYLV